MRQLLKRKLLLASVIFIAVLPILASALFITYRSFQQAKLDAVAVLVWTVSQAPVLGSPGDSAQ